MGMTDMIKKVHEVTSAQTIMAGHGRIMVHLFVWHPAAANNDLMVKDGSGNVLYKCRAAGAAPNGENAYACWQVINATCLGLVVETIDGGTLYVYQG